jgi:hypothetical protein
MIGPFDKPTREQAAFHGAGHAMALLHLGWTFEQMEINIEHEYALDCPCWCDGVKVYGISVGQYAENRYTGVFRKRTESEIRSILDRQVDRKAALLHSAGHVATLIHDGAWSPFSSPGEPIFGCEQMILASSIGERYKLPSRAHKSEIEFEINKYRKQAWTLLKKPANWRAVEALAAIVQAQNQVSGETAFAVLRAAQGTKARQRARTPEPRFAAPEDNPIILSDSVEGFLKDIQQRLDEPKDPNV